MINHVIDQFVFFFVVPWATISCNQIFATINKTKDTIIELKHKWMLNIKNSTENIKLWYHRAVAVAAVTLQ